MFLLFRTLLCALLFSAYASQSIAQEWLANMEEGIAECDIEFRDASYIDGECYVSFRVYSNEIQMQIGTSAYKYSDEEKLLLENKIVFLRFEDNDIDKIHYIGFVMEGSSKVADGYGYNSGKPLSFKNGCTEGGVARICLKYVKSSNQNAVETAFIQLPIKSRVAFQKFLAATKFYEGKIDGAWGEVMESAIRQFTVVNELQTHMLGYKYYKLGFLPSAVDFINDVIEQELSEQNNMRYLYDKSTFCLTEYRERVNQSIDDILDESRKVRATILYRDMLREEC